MEKEIELKNSVKAYEEQLNIERILLTPSSLKTGNEIQIFASEMISLQEKRFGPKGDMISQRSKLIQPSSGSKVLSVVKQIAEERI